MQYKKILLTFLCFMFLISPAFAAEEMIVNGDFSRNGYGWTEQISVAGPGDASIEYGTTLSKTRAAYLVVTNGPDYIYASLSQSVDLTYVESLTFSLMDIGVASGSGWGDFIVRIDDSTEIYSIDVNNLPVNSWGHYSIDVSNYYGRHNLTFLVYFEPVSSSPNNFVIGITDISAISQASAPTYISSSLDKTTVSTGDSLTASILVNGGVPNTSFDIVWGDGQTTSRNVVTQGQFTEIITHTYTSPGTYSITGSVYTPGIGFGTEFNIGTITVVSLDFSGYPTSGDPPLVVQFTTDGANIESVLWDFGDGATSTQTAPVHTYAASQTAYTVTLTGYTTLGQSVTITKENYILASPQLVTWAQTS